VTGVQTCALPIWTGRCLRPARRGAAPEAQVRLPAVKTGERNRWHIREHVQELGLIGKHATATECIAAMRELLGEIHLRGNTAAKALVRPKIEPPERAGIGRPRARLVLHGHG
jgi:hypothetical protein